MVMTFAIFVMWVLMGVLGGLLAGLVVKRGGYGLKRDIILGLVGSIGLGWLVRAIGLVSGSGVFLAAVVALLGAAVALVVQRKLRPADQSGEARADLWWRWGLGAAVVAIIGWMMFAPAQPPAAIAAVTEDKTYAVTPSTMRLKAGIVTGEVTDMKVTERVDQASGRVVSAAKLTARIALKNSSTNQTVRLVTGKVLYIDTKGHPIKLEDNRADPIVKFASSDRLDPGQETAESLDVDFPADALKGHVLKTIRLELAYVPSPYREEIVNLSVSVGDK
jgi:uncharacterized membrane protein YeaQ/YmgE (transglycosylase-associated protein family)